MSQVATVIAAFFTGYLLHAIVAMTVFPPYAKFCKKYEAPK